jgi:hypothetical protein
LPHGAAALCCPTGEFGHRAKTQTLEPVLIEAARHRLALDIVEPSIEVAQPDREAVIRQFDANDPDILT